MKTDKLNERILQRAEEELYNEIEKFIAILNTKAKYDPYEKVSMDDKEISLGNANSFKYALERMVKAGYLKSLHTKKINKILNQCEL
tara:strand:- start:971 stop:1231 length:261 start_codon:yes stop_codon:yes gene_type:complete